MDEATNATAVFIPTDDGSLPCKTRRQFELDQYYDHIQPHTFDTRIVAFSLEEAKAWREYNRGAAEGGGLVGRLEGPAGGGHPSRSPSPQRCGGQGRGGS
ncbi:hypothetical protein QOT17_011310 [Balamuthia mandrillaris]